MAQNEVVIECPYLTASRMEMFYPVFQRLLSRKIKIKIVTRDPSDHDDEYMRDHAANEILKSKELGIDITLLKGNHHRKLAIVDKKILWEGSLNILSQNNSKEIMRRLALKRVGQAKRDLDTRNRILEERDIEKRPVAKIDARPVAQNAVNEQDLNDEQIISAEKFRAIREAAVASQQRRVARWGATKIAA